MYPLAQSAALTVPFFAHDANGDGVTGMIDGGFTKRISKNGAAYGAMTVTITEMENGWYSLPVGAGHSDTLGVLSISLSNASAKRVNLQFRVHVRLPDDLAFPATSGRSIDVTTGGAVGLDWANVEGQATAVNLSATTTNLVNTTTTNSDMRGTESALLAASAPTNFGDLSITVTTGLVDITQTAADKVWSTAARILTANTNFNDPTAATVADAVWDEVLTLAAHDVAESAGRRVRNLQEFGGYEDGAIWIDTVNGVAGTTDFENGTVGNPVNSIGDANALASSLGLTRFRVTPGSSITFVAAQSNQVFVGDAWTLALGGQSLVGTTIIGATVSGVASGAGTTQAFEKCHLMATSHIKGTHLIESAIEGTLTIVEAGDFFVDRCYSAIAGTATPTWDFGGALGASNVSFRNYSGGIEIQNMGAGAGSYNMSLEGRGQLIINANCSATSTVAIRGLFTVTDNAGGAVTLSDDARFTRSEVADSVWDEILTGATHNIATSAGRRLRGIQEFQGYENGAIWIDTVDGTPGIIDFENGTVENPVDSIADANTLAASLNIERFEIAPGSSVTFAASQNNQTFRGHNWTLALGGQDIAGSGIFGATVSGVASGTGTTQIFDKCILNAVSHIKGTHLVECGIAGTQTIAEAGDSFTDRCHSAIAGTATPVWDFGAALNSSNLSFRNYSGGVEIQNMGAGTGSYTMSLEGRGQLIINANCSATSTVAIRGLFTVTDNAGGAVTLSDDARFDVNQGLTIAVGGIVDGATAAAELNNIADGCLDRRLDLGTDTGGNTTTSRTWRQALRTARNRVAIAAGTMTVYEEDDITSDFTAVISTTAGDPITELNPA